MTVNIPAYSEPFGEDENTVRQRVNGYVTDTDINLREGDFFQTLTEPCVKEFATGYAAINFMLKMSNPMYAEGVYLDLVGVQYATQRKSALAATGVVTFSGTAGTLIPSGTRVSSPATTSQQTSIRFLTIADANIGGGGMVDVDVIAEEAGSAGSVGTGAVEVLEDTISGVTGVLNAADFSGGTDVEDDSDMRQRMLDNINEPQAAGSGPDLRRWALERAGVTAATVVTTWEGPWTARIVLLGEDNQPVPDSVIEDVQRYLTGPAVLLDPTSALSSAAGSAGAITAAAVRYKVTFMDDSGAETKPGPASTPLAVTAKRIAITSIPIGPTGTVARRLYRADTTADHTAGIYRLATTIGSVAVPDNAATTYTDNLGSVAGLRLVPKANNTSDFDGKAPVGQRITVDTPIVVAIDIVADLVLEAGYTFDGAGGTINVTPAIVAALSSYISSLPPGGDVIYFHVLSTVFNVTGVYDVTSLNIQSGTANVVLDDGQVAALGGVTLS